MPRANSYSKLLGFKSYDCKTNSMQTYGQIRKSESDFIMDMSWDNDIQSRKAYVYSYEDYINNPEEINYYKHKTKLYNPNKKEVDIKFIISTYGTLAKDQVEYHVQFRNIDTLKELFPNYEDAYDVEFPIGLYIDIPDDTYETYYRFLICSKYKANQFVKYSVLPCNYNFRWCKQNIYHSMWGVAKLRNSYNSGVWRDFVFQYTENQDQIWLPLNNTSEMLYYNDRFIICASNKLREYVFGQEPEPIVWQVTKVETVHPLGIVKLTIGQTNYIVDKDKKLKQVNDDGYYWYGNGDSIISTSIKNTDNFTINAPDKIYINGSFKTIIFNGSYDSGIDINFISPITWTFKVNNVKLDESQIKTIYINNTTTKIKILSEKLDGEKLLINGKDIYGHSADFESLICL